MKRTPKSRDADAAIVAEGAKLLPLAILDGYKVRWSRETVARDIVQNFFDEVADFRAVTIEVHAVEKRVRIAGPSTFDLDYLRYIGATTKTGRRSAGGFGEGFKICALVLARDYHAEVVAGSGDWQIRPRLVPMKLGRELHYEVRRSAPGDEFPGSFVEIRGADAGLCKAFESSRELFRHDDNPRLASPLFVDAAAGIGVFIARDPKHGDVFYRRQHRAVLPFSKGDGLTFAFDDRLEGLDADRDRRSLRATVPLIKAVLERVPTEVLEKIVLRLRAYWSKGNAVLRVAVEEAAARGVRMTFSRRWLARTDHSAYKIEAHAERRGYLLGSKQFAKIGMPTVLVRFGDLEVPREPTPRETARVAVARALHLRLVGREPVSRGYRVSEARGHSHYGGLSVIATESLAGSFEDGIGDVLAGLASGGGRHRASNADRLTSLIEAALSGKVDLEPYRACWISGEAPPDPLAPVVGETDEQFAEFRMSELPTAVAVVLAPTGFPPIWEFKRRIQSAAKARQVNPWILTFPVDNSDDAWKHLARGLPSIWIGGKEVEPEGGKPRYGVRTFAGPEGRALLPTEEVLGALLADQARFRAIHGARHRLGRAAFERFLRNSDPERHRQLLRKEAITAAIISDFTERTEHDLWPYPSADAVDKLARPRLAARIWDEAGLADAALEEVLQSVAELGEILAAVRRIGADLEDPERVRLCADVTKRLVRALDGSDPEGAVAALLARVPSMIRLRKATAGAPLDEICVELCVADATDLWFQRGAPETEDALVEAEARIAAAIDIAVDRHGRTDEEGARHECRSLREEIDAKLGLSSYPDLTRVASAARAEAVGAAWKAALAEGLGEIAAAERCLAVAATMSAKDSGACESLPD